MKKPSKKAVLILAGAAVPMTAAAWFIPKLVRGRRRRKPRL